MPWPRLWLVPVRISPTRVGLVLGLALFGVSCSSARVGKTDTEQPVRGFPANFAEGDNDAGAVTADEPTAVDGGTRSPPDPPAVSASRQWEYEVMYDHGEVRITDVRSIELDEPVLSARRMGRFAIELWIGSELLERVRFEIPLVEPPRTGKKRPLHEPPQFGPGLSMTKRLRIPQLERATNARLIDRATGKTTRLPWPPQPSTAKSSSTAKPASTDSGKP